MGSGWNCCCQLSSRNHLSHISKLKIMKALPWILGGLFVAGAGTAGYFYFTQQNAASSGSGGSGSGSGSGSNSGSGNKVDSIINTGTNLLTTGTAAADKVKNAISSITGNSDRSKIDQQVYAKVAAMYPTAATVSTFNDYLKQSSGGKASYSNAFVRDVTEQYWTIMKKYGAEPRPKGTFGYKDVSGIMNSQVLPEFFQWLTGKYPGALGGMGAVNSNILN
jgi:hypothetical protein